MPEGNKVFISWSGRRSRAAANALRKWLRTVLQATNPWMSDRDIEKGSVGVNEILRALDGSRMGIICLTPENLTEEWLNFEAGALLKTPNAESRVYTYLLAGLEQAQLKYPLAMFQGTKAEKEQTRKLIRDINNQLEPPSLDEETLDTVFDKMWPDLEEQLSNLPPPTSPIPPERTPHEIATETLELLRAVSPTISDIASEVQYISAWTGVRATALGEIQEFTGTSRFAPTAGIPGTLGFANLGKPLATTTFGTAQLPNTLRSLGEPETTSPENKKHTTPSKDTTADTDNSNQKVSPHQPSRKRAHFPLPSRKPKPK